jgi:hypothetical protein
MVEKQEKLTVTLSQQRLDAKTELESARTTADTMLQTLRESSTAKMAQTTSMHLTALKKLQEDTQAQLINKK